MSLFSLLGCHVPFQLMRRDTNFPCWLSHIPEATFFWSIRGHYYKPENNQNYCKQMKMADSAWEGMIVRPYTLVYRNAWKNTFIGRSSEWPDKALVFVDPSEEEVNAWSYDMFQRGDSNIMVSSIRKVWELKGRLWPKSSITKSHPRRKSATVQNTWWLGQQQVSVVCSCSS